MKSLKKTIISNIYYQKIIRNKGTYIMDEDWDNLIILDSCRYDMFRALNIINGRLEYRISRGSCTNEFLKENFKEKKYFDTVYITANPLVDYYVSKSFLEIVSVWKHGWNKKLGTVLPETTVKYAINADKKFPHNRLIIHFVQPHYPFLGKESRKKIGEHEGMVSISLFLENKNINHSKQTIWNLLKEGKVEKETVWNAYEENLKIVLEYANELVKKLNGKTIISSDHGNLFGEWLLPFPIREYGHPGGIYKKNLIQVPWLIIDKVKRKDIAESEKMKIKKAIKKLHNVIA